MTNLLRVYLRFGAFGIGDDSGLVASNIEPAWSMVLCALSETHCRESELDTSHTLVVIDD